MKVHRLFHRVFLYAVYERSVLIYHLRSSAKELGTARAGSELVREIHNIHEHSITGIVYHEAQVFRRRRWMRR